MCNMSSFDVPSLNHRHWLILKKLKGVRSNMCVIICHSLSSSTVEPGFYSTNWLFIGKCHQHLGNKQEARKWLQKAANYECHNADDEKVGDLTMYIIPVPPPSPPPPPLPPPPLLPFHRPRRKLNSCWLSFSADVYKH